MDTMKERLRKQSEEEIQILQNCILLSIIVVFEKLLKIVQNISSPMIAILFQGSLQEL